MQDSFLPLFASEYGWKCIVYQPFALGSIPHDVWLLLDLCHFDVIGTLCWIVCPPSYVDVSEWGTVNQKSQKTKVVEFGVDQIWALHHVCSVELGEMVADPFVGGNLAIFAGCSTPLVLLRKFASTHGGRFLKPHLILPDGRQPMLMLQRIAENNGNWTGMSSASISAEASTIWLQNVVCFEFNGLEGLNTYENMNQRYLGMWKK